jgi:hypothetical protein
MRFAADVQPLLTASATGCASCHSPGSGRQFLVYPTAQATFDAASAAGLLAPRAGGLLDRVTRPASDPLGEPRGKARWSSAQVSSLTAVACEFDRATGGPLADGGAPPAPDGGAGGTDAGPPVDEQFPAYLLAPWDGGPSTDFDDTFLAYEQLRGKVVQVFSDAWVRDGGDQFASHIAEFGGVDFTSHFVEARGATSDFLLGLDQLTKDVCSQAVAQSTGPFAGLDTSAVVTDVAATTTQLFHANDPTELSTTVGAADGTFWDLYSNGALATTQPVSFPSAGTYTFTVAAKGSLNSGIGPDMALSLGSTLLQTFTNLPITEQTYTFTTAVPQGPQVVSIAFTNDAYDSSGDRNLYVDTLQIDGPQGTGTGTQNATAARTHLNALYRAMLFRDATSQELDDTYTLLTDLLGISGDLADSWSGVCEALLRHPDFLWTLPPSISTVSGTAQQELQLVKVAQDLVARPPTAEEIQQVISGTATLSQMIDGYLAGTEFRDHFFYKMRIRVESDGSTDADEPARLWVYLMTTGQPFHLLLDGTFGVDTQFQPLTRPTYHGATGLLTMKGFILHKPGLPHYNYAARVLEDFLGYTFEVPPSVVAMRIGATAASTVDPTSICFSCHRLLTPLATQRGRWADDGTYSTTNAAGQTIDDTDQNLVANYPYAGEGLAAFSQKAVRQERFIHHTLDAQMDLLFGRPLRYDQDERVLYHQLWNLTGSSQGDLRQTLKAMMLTPQYQTGSAQ